MTVAEALRDLEQGSPHQRVKAARYLSRHATAAELGVLRIARQGENVAYVKTSLDAAIKRLSRVAVSEPPPPGDDYDVPDEVRQRIRTQAVEWVAGLLLHEISSPIGLATRAATREIADYEKSRTKVHLDSVARTFEAIEQLKNAAALPRPVPFDLAVLLDEIVTAEAPEGGAGDVSVIGPRPLLLISDPLLIRLIVANGLRNAFEAVALTNPVAPHAIVVSFGETDVDYWVSILDRGTGIIGPIESAFEVGKTTKRGHSGFGLAIARQAVETLGGTILLGPVDGGGARCEARWEK